MSNMLFAFGSNTLGDRPYGAPTRQTYPLTEVLLGSVDGHQQVSFVLSLQGAASWDINRKGT